MNALTLTDFQKDGIKYLTFSNQDGKQWSIPTKNMRVGLEIYQPSGIRGKILKAFLPIITKFGVAKTVLTGTYTSICLSDKLREMLEECFGTECEYSVFWGTPCVDQKATIQIHKKRKILGYCKIGCSERLKELFLHEKKVLGLLEKNRMPHVARCVAMEQIEEHCWAFVQSTEKQIGKKTGHSFGEKQKQFLENLWLLTKQNSLFEETDYYQSLVFLEQNLKHLPVESQATVKKALQMVKEHYKEKVVEWGMSHRDFTPWNTCMVNNELFVFDFEYALLQAPKGIDYWHFFVQTKCFEEKCDMMEVVKIYKNSTKEKEEEFLFINYLLDIMSMYLSRGTEEDLVIAGERAMLLTNIIN